MDIIKRIDELKKLVDSDKFDKKYEGQKKTEVLAGQHVISACEDIKEFGDKIIAKVTFGYSDPKTGVSMISETVIADKGTDLKEIKETALLSLIGSIENKTIESSVAEAVEAEVSENQENVSENEKADIDADTEKEPENKEEIGTVGKQNNTEVADTASEKTEEKSNEDVAQTEAENTADSVTEDNKKSDSDKKDAEDIITENASEIFENKEPSAKNPLNEDFTENKAVDKTETEEKVEVVKNTQDTAQNKSEKTSKKAENKNPAKKDVDKTDNEKSENTEIPEYKPKTLDKIQVQEIEVLAKHLAENKDDRNAVLKKFFERLNFHKGLKKEYADEIKNLLAEESQRLANRYGEEILNLMFDKAYKLISPETEGENLLLKIDSLKILVCATALVVCEAALHEIMV